MPPAIPLPAISSESEKIVIRPAAPSDPPTIKDITNAFRFTQNMLNATVKDEEVVDAEVYKNKLLSAREGSDPVCLAGVVAQLKDAIGDLLDEKLAPIKADLGDLKADVEDLKAGQAHVQRMAAIMHNRSSGSGADVKLEVVPFIDGRNPTKPPLNLPPLTCRTNLQELSGHDRDQYYKGYYPQALLPSVIQRVSKILLAIGADTY